MIGPREALYRPSAFDPYDPFNGGLRWLRRQRGIAAPDARYVDDEEVFAHHVELLASRVEAGMDTVVIVTGEPRTGKSTLALSFGIALGERLGTGFGVRRDVSYRLSELLGKIREAESTRTIVADEAVLAGAQAAGGVAKDTGILERALAICGYKHVTLFMLAPSVWLFARAIRERRAAFWVHVEERGHATVRELSHRLRFKSSDSQLPFFPVSDPWFHLRWESLDGTPLWADYEELKFTRGDHELEGVQREALKWEKRIGVTREPHETVEGESEADRRRRLKRLWMRDFRARQESQPAKAGPEGVRQSTHKRPTSTPKPPRSRQTSVGRGRSGGESSE